MEVNLNKIANPILDKIVFIGPDLNGRGGMSSVLNEYSKWFSPFHFHATNSHHGSLRGILNWGLTMIKLPIDRIRGRKILHIHYASGKSWIRKQTIAQWGRCLGFKTIMHCHTNIYNVAQRHGIKTTSNALKRSSHNIVLASPFLNYAIETLKLNNVSIVNNIAEISHPIKSSTHATTKFLFLGLLNQSKGIYDLLSAANILSSEGYKFTIIVCGAGETDLFKSKVNDYGLNNFIDYRGWVTGKEKEKAFEDSDILVLPSHSEAMPVSILEAMSLGMPVIATEVGAIPDMINNGCNGILFQPGDVDALANAMRHYLDDNHRIQSEGDASLKLVKNYSAESVMEQLVRIYGTILK